MSKNSAAVEKCDKRMGGYSQAQRNNLLRQSNNLQCKYKNLNYTKQND